MRSRCVLILCLLLAGSLLPLKGVAQNTNATTTPVASDAKVETILAHAIEALGGPAYLNIQTVVGRGFFTSFKDGVSQDPARFLDYIAYPNRERTEFTTFGVRTIQTNSGETGWLFDGATKTLSDIKSQQVEDFKRSMRTSVENLLRGWWRKDNAKLTYVGRREAGLGRRNETVRLTYPDGFWVEYEFAAKEGLPAKVIYKTSKAKADTDEKEELVEEDRLGKLITVGGVTAPWVIDHFINGAQTSRIGYESIEYNQPLPDTLFAKPANIKSLK
ncbi:MAG: hypothetical protein QOJ88_280 [Pyrinomonadaceae bacterium]|nr:hypothetical protein [Pyrinomonadaceae bacterium]